MASLFFLKRKEVHSLFSFPSTFPSFLFPFSCPLSFFLHLTFSPSFFFLCVLSFILFSFLFVFISFNFSSELEISEDFQLPRAFLCQFVFQPQLHEQLKGELLPYLTSAFGLRPLVMHEVVEESAHTINTKSPLTAFTPPF